MIIIGMMSPHISYTPFGKVTGVENNSNNSSISSLNFLNSFSPNYIDKINKTITLGINNTHSLLLNNLTLFRNSNASYAVDNLRWVPALTLLKTYGHKLGFESGDISSGWEWGQSRYDNNPPQNAQIPRLSPDNNLHIEGKNSLKVTVDPLDYADNGARAEVSLSKPPINLHGGEYFFDGDEVWYHWYELYPKDFQIPLTFKDDVNNRRVDAWNVVTQWHQPAGVTLCRDPSQSGAETPCPMVPLGFNLQNWDKSRNDRPSGSIGETLQFGVGDKAKMATTGSIDLWHTPLQKGIWYEFLLHVYWKACGNPNDDISVRYDASGACVKERGAFQEMWIRHWNVNGLPQDFFNPTYISKFYHYNLDEKYVRFDSQGNKIYYGCDTNDYPNLCPDPQYNGAVFLRQGLYHCNPSVHNHCPGSGLVANGRIPCDPRATIEPCPPKLPAPADIPPTPLETMYYDGMQILRCSDQIPSILKQTICEAQHNP